MVRTPSHQPATVVFDPSLTEYDFGPQHPMSPLRVALTMRLVEAMGLLEEGPDGAAPALRLVPPPMASVELLMSVHDEGLIDAVVRAGTVPGYTNPGLGLGTEDNPTFPRMHEASAHIVGATVEACRQVWSGESGHSVNIAGGLHHSMRHMASGFCIYNDVAVGIQWLLDHGAERIAYVDVDVHHGDGVQAIFYDDPRVLTISLHETGQVLFPGTGFAAEDGGPEARGSAVNVALPPGTGDGGWLRAFHAVVPPLVTEFAPDVLVTQHGCDSHREDPLAHLMLTVDGQRAAYLALHDLAHTASDGRWVATGGGGYAVVDVVPRAWTHLLAIVADCPIDPETEVPASWRRHVESETGLSAPRLFTDGTNPLYRDWSAGYDPNSALDRAILATRGAVFPWHGLDPLL